MLNQIFEDTSNGTYDNDFIQSSPAKFFPKKNSVLERFWAIGEGINQCHRCGTSLPYSVLDAKSNIIVAHLSVAAHVRQSQGPDEGFKSEGLFICDPIVRQGG
jgi:hypothetical protein